MAFCGNLPAKRGPVSADEVEKMYELSRRGFGYRGIGKKIGRSHLTVRKYLDGC